METSPEGTKFSVLLPIGVHKEALDEIAPMQAIKSGPSDSKLTKVLCIEDNSQSLSLIENVMTRHFGCDVISAMLGELGLALAVQHKPDLILLDLDLPDMSGLDVLQMLRSDPKTRAISVVVLSADATEATRQKAMATEATTYLTKPLDLRLFVKTVEDIAC